MIWLAVVGILTNQNLCQWCHWMWWGILTNQILDISMGLRGSLRVVSVGLCGWWWGKLTNENLCQWCHWMWWGILTNQILDVSMGGLCGFLCLHGSLQVVSVGGLHGWSPQVSMGGLCGSPWVSAGGLHGWSLRVVPAGLCGWSPWVVSVGLHGSPWVVVGKINQSKSVPMMSLNVVGNINQSNSRCLRGGLCGSPWVSAGLHGSLRVVSVGLHG